MCGRYTLTLDEKLLRELLNISLDSFNFQPNYNIHPGADVPVIVSYDRSEPWDGLGDSSEDRSEPGGGLGDSSEDRLEPWDGLGDSSEDRSEPGGGLGDSSEDRLEPGDGLGDNSEDRSEPWDGLQENSEDRSESVLASARLMRWGLIPRWAKTPSTGYKMINARGETVHEKPAYRGPFQAQRCLVPADGFYEWQKHPDGKIPYRIVLPDSKPFTFPGLWDKWISPKGEELYSFTIITVDASSSIQDIHNRMPVIFDNDSSRRIWMDLSSSTEKLKGLLRPYAGELILYQVSTLVNSPKNNFPELIERVI